MSMPSILIERLSERAAQSTVDIERPETVRDDGLYARRTYVSIRDNVPAVVSLRSGSEALRYGRENTRRFGILLLAPDVDLKPADRVIHGDQVYDVLSVRTPGSRSFSDHLAYQMAEIQETA